jgi:hypothetical protein
MKIVHLYPQNNAMIAHYVSMAEQGMGKKAECALANDEKSLAELCKAEAPDILHLHGCQQAALVRAARKAGRNGARIVFTPHGELLAGSAGKGLAPFVAHAYAVTAQSPIEQACLTRLGWNDRIELIRNPIITRTTSATELSQQLYAVYQKVLASDVLALMDDDTKQALRLLLKAGITGDIRWLSAPSAFSSLAPDWQKLYVYAEQEGVLPVVLRGIDVTGLQAPSPVPSPIYLPNGYQKPEPTYDETAMELVLKVKAECENGTRSVLRLCELDRALRVDRLDEEVLLLELKAAKLTGFFSAVLQILSEQTGLDEGFMPCLPVNNAVTGRIRTIITNHLKI